MITRPRHDDARSQEWVGTRFIEALYADTEFLEAREIGNGRQVGHLAHFTFAHWARETVDRIQGQDSQQDGSLEHLSYGLGA